MNSRGLGDTIEKITEATGIKSVVNLLFGEDCGCEKRKQFLNTIFPYEVECLNEQEYNYLNIIDFTKQIFTKDELQELDRIHNRVFANKMQKCGSCWAVKIKDLNTVYIEYKHNRHSL